MEDESQALPEEVGHGEVLLPQEDSAYIARMLAKADGTEAPAEQAPETPAKLADEFDTPEQLAEAYKALKAQLAGKAPEQAPEATQPVTIEQAKEAVEGAGLDFTALEQEYRETGDLSPEARAELAKKGIGKDMVDAFLSGQKAAETLGRQKVFETVGGEQNYRAMVQWAGTHLAPEEVEAFNEVARGANFAALRLAAAGLYARYEATVGREPRLVTANGTRPSVDVYESWAQVRADMGRREYDRDPAFRRGVEAKLARSQL